jgi:hypothetical protein
MQDDEYPYVYAITGYGPGVVAGGRFDRAGDADASNIAFWDGSQWTPLGCGMNAPVHALTVHGGELIAGGEFTSAGEVACAHIARWDGASWQPLHDGLDQPVFALATHGDVLVAGGSFSFSGASPVSRIARWIGGRWMPLGSGMDNTVRALFSTGEALWVGGDFTSAGLNVSHRVALWLESPTYVDDPGNGEGIVLSFSNPYRAGDRLQLRAEEFADEASMVMLYSVDGRLVRILHAEGLSGGFWSFRWDGRNESGVPVGSGVYFARPAGRDDLSRASRLILVR